MTHEEEELQHDISKLRDQVQQISLSQRTTKDELKGDMDGLKGDMNSLKSYMKDFKDNMKANIDGIEEKMKGNLEDLKNGLKADLIKLLQEMFPSGEKVLDETHDENKINVNHDIINSNFGLKAHHFPIIDIRKFD